ncbi:zinc finger protein 540-like [Pollicipes pollicipes]|uniref:zinc finger protein 540-like n=1 Tax=Pollicipes pollicipes TaxID=41117 RepID=UPI00188598C3|nr:zinc finger protein 540-like [Pollicipes pollicipes]
MLKMDADCSDTAIIPILPTCCFICNSSEAETDVNHSIIEDTGSSLSELVQLVLPDSTDELQLISAVCASCVGLLAEYDQLRLGQARLADHVRSQYASSQLARSSLDVIIEMGDNRVTVPYGVYREHRAPLPAADSLDLEIHVQGGRLCHVCDASFGTFGELARHLRAAHQLSSSEIRACGAAFRRADMCRKHEATHRAQVSAHRCELCGKTLCYRHGLKRHLQSQHGLAAKHPVVCAEVFADYGKYLFHCRSVHLQEPDVGFGCESCGRRFEKRSELRLHRETHQDTSYSCVTCDKHFKTRLAYQKHARVHSGGGWRCEHCNKVFDTRPNLATHLQTHSARRAHACADCGATFKFGQTLARHRAVRHSGATPRYVCDVCGKAFARALLALGSNAADAGPVDVTFEVDL